MVNTTYNSTQDMIDKLQQFKGKTKLKFFKITSNYYIEMKRKNFQTYQQDPFAKIAQGFSKIYHEIILLMIFLQTKPQIKNMNISFYELYYTVIKTRDENEDMDTQYENDYNDFITPNHHVGIKPRETLLR